jgi:NAD(P)-dependent dehydrogenase (short-subunit alcohol dehydrogenase family)
MVNGPRTALVTGAASGIGSEIVLALARDGFDLAVAEMSVDHLAKLLKHSGLSNRKVVPLAFDLRDPAGIADGFAAARAALGEIDLLVNNAGRALVKPVVDVTAADWDDLMDANLRGAFLLSQCFGRAAIAAKRPGAIVTMASTHGMTGIAGRAVYGIAKAGLIQMTKMLAIEWAEHDIRANAIAPTTVLTPSRAAMLSDPKAKQQMLERIPTRRFVTPEEVAAAVVYLASPAAKSITGHTLLLDGGLTAC